jgi:hypothetical protein
LIFRPLDSKEGGFQKLLLGILLADISEQKALISHPLDQVVVSCEELLLSEAGVVNEWVIL